MDETIKRIIDNASLPEKAALVIGQDRWHTAMFEKAGIRPVMMTDGPHGLRSEDSQVDLSVIFLATCFPAGCSLASSWDRDLIREIGQALGDEAREEKIDVILGPGANIKRSPLCGRNFEYYSEDPFLSGEMAAAFIDGVQSRGVGTSLKHFAANNQETNRMTINAFIDDRAFREIYLAGFEKAVKQGRPWTVMCSYNRINGTFASENKELLHTILREEWGFEGLVVSDWGAVNDRVEGLAAGMDLEMPGPVPDHARAIVKAVKEGRFEEAVLDRAVSRVIALARKSSEKNASPAVYDRNAHHALAVRAACEGAVLLKNDSGLLPLKKDAKIALIGEFAVNPRYQGAGSSQVNPNRLDTAFDAGLRLPFHPAITYARGYDIASEEALPELLEEAVRAAAGAEVAIVMAGLTDALESESFDRKNLKMPRSHEELIRRVAEANPNTVVVLCNGAPVEMPWLSDVNAVLELYLSGQGGGTALWKLLYGEVNPSGKLAETFPERLADTPCHAWFPMGPRGVEYRESLYVGYRYYDTADVPPLFPFGFGLSYTDFSYSDLTLREEHTAEGGDVIVSFTVKNTGAVPGKETAQIYVRDVKSTFFRPDRELKGFAKISLEPGEAKEIRVRLDRRAFAFYNPAIIDWQVEPGEFEILAGSSSRDIRLAGSITVRAGTPAAADEAQALQCYTHPTRRWSITDEDFARLCGRPILHKAPDRKGTFDANSTLTEVRSVFLGRCFGAVIDMMIQRETRNSDEKYRRMVTEQMRDMPLRFLVMNSGGKFSQKMLDGLILMLNGRHLRGLRKVLSRKQ